MNCINHRNLSFFIIFISIHWSEYSSSHFYMYITNIKELLLSIINAFINFYVRIWCKLGFVFFLIFHSKLEHKTCESYFLSKTLNIRPTIILCTCEWGSRQISGSSVRTNLHANIANRTPIY